MPAEMPTLEDFLPKASMAEEEFVALHTHPVLLALGLSEGEFGDRHGEKGTVRYTGSRRAKMGKHPLAGRVFPLVGRRAKGATRITIGRAPQNDVILPEGSISDQHCAIRLGDEARIEDLGSTNGTFVNGQRLRAAESVPLPDDSMLTLGRYTFVFLSPRKFHRTLILLAKR